MAPSPYQYKVACPQMPLFFRLIYNIVEIVWAITEIIFSRCLPLFGFYLWAMAELTSLSKLKALDLSGNEFSGSIELQGKFSQIFHCFVKDS